ncbi:retrovirus-related Pol polyprotein from transposon 297 [Trichonephila clavipes]|nr:retrovirus-related Pol polyprotein from transposon 297 [Trichonephila clavipes]
MPTTRAMEAQFQTLLEKLTEMKSDLTASMNANMGEMKSELTASMNANMGELNTKLTNVNEQISANKEELKSDLKGIGDKLTTMDKKFEEMEGRIERSGVVLSQEIDGQERVVAYWSKCLSKPERNYCVTRKELLAIVKAIEHFHHYLYGQKFLLRTDHASLTWLMNFRNTEGQVARWIQRLNEYYFDIRHRKGSSHGNADALSRRPCPENCRHCSRVETKYDYAIRQITTSTATPPDP